MMQENSSEVQWQEGEWRKKGIEGKEKKRETEEEKKRNTKRKRNEKGTHHI